MSEPTPEAEAPAVPEPTRLETVARLAAEAAVRAMPDYTLRLQALDDLTAAVTEIRQTLATAAGPDGGAARLAARLDDAEARLTAITAAEPGPNPGQQQALDDLAAAVAEIRQADTRQAVGDLTGAVAEIRQAVADLAGAEPAPNPGQQRLIDDLRLKLATLERTNR